MTPVNCVHGFGVATRHDDHIACGEFERLENAEWFCEWLHYDAPDCLDQGNESLVEVAAKGFAFGIALEAGP